MPSTNLRHPEERAEGQRLEGCLVSPPFSDRWRRREIGAALFEVRGKALFHIGSAKAEEFQRQRGVKGCAHRAQPVVERILGPADRALRALGELGRDLDRFRLELVVVDCEGYQAETLRFFA